MPDPRPVPGLHLVKTTSREEDSLASDVVDILQDGLRAGVSEVGGADAGGVEGDYQTTREAEEAARTEREFFNAIGTKLRERCSDWADGRRGLQVVEQRDNARRGWRFGVYDRDGRFFEVECLWSSLAELAAQQRSGTLHNFDLILNKVIGQFQEARRTYFARRDGVSLQ